MGPLLISNGNVADVCRCVYVGCTVLPFADEAAYSLSLSSARRLGGEGESTATDMERFSLNFLQ